MKRLIIVAALIITGGFGVAAAAGILGAPLPAPLPSLRMIVPVLKSVPVSLPSPRPLLGGVVDAERLIRSQA